MDEEVLTHKIVRESARRLCDRHIQRYDRRRILDGAQVRTQ